MNLFAGVVRQVESLQGRMAESERQVDALFESLLNEAFQGEGRPFNAVGRYVRQGSVAQQVSSQSLASCPYVGVLR